MTLINSENYNIDDVNSKNPIIRILLLFRYIYNSNIKYTISKKFYLFFIFKYNMFYGFIS